MMVGFWEVPHQAIFESFVTGSPLPMGEPGQVDGPGCINCGQHWMSARNEVCEGEAEEAIEEVFDE